ncbi:elongation factor 1-gamma [Ascoidea rubescens DSM 1968]|uniref:EF1G-domain-containing protein n=1 Tax=Ascoidea rubescens DSM 1968 TaxID=1344418 RepID=A0A1D2VL30_9ASCO|nr:EF1G-domain-containing protein [Ascoidea rubescens DSM 1968]ODV62320.1 EF1G-domain-containing protein [Ascoidea rubescens DSM 1968]
MSQATLYTTASIRGVLPKAFIDYFKLDVAVKTPESDAENYTRNFPLKKVPTFIDAESYKLHECIAINLYLLKSSDPKNTLKLLGSSTNEKILIKDYCQIIKWLSFANSELLYQLPLAFKPLTGASPYNKKQVENALVEIDKIVDVFEKRLTNFTYLVGERISLADLFSATLATRGFDHLWGDEWRAKFPNFVRWYKTVISHPILYPIYKDYKFREKPVEFVPPKKEKKQQPKKQEKKQKPKEDDQEDEQLVKKKQKHPLEALGKSTIPLDEWKRVYSNEETRETALPYFWDKFFNPEEWSLWKVGYKYNDELTLTFMSNNLVGGFFNRLSASTKYLFGCLVVYGVNNNNGIIGALLVRGQDFKPAFEVAPDWESYEYEKLDASSAETKDFVNNMWAWDKPVVIGGKSIEISDGKVLK